PMFKKLFITAIFLISLRSFAQEKMYLFSTFREPATEGLYLASSVDGYHWEDLGGPYLKPEVGQQKVMRDPSVAQDPDGTFHMVWTSSWKGDPGFGYASTKDFIHWTPERFIPVMTHDTSTVNVWAPELFYDDENKDFIIVWASTVPFRFEKGEEEERNNHRLYYTTTKDFKTFSETRLYLDPGFSVIDAVIVKRGKKDYVLVHKDNTRPNRNMKVSFGTTPLGPWSKSSESFTSFKTEGPTVAKVGNEYLVYYDSYGDFRYGAVRTADFKKFEDVSSQISLPEGHKHGTIFMVDKQIVQALSARKPVHYSGKTLNNPDYHHGQLSHAMGVHNIQVMRANREFPELADGFGWTYNHAPMLAYWNGKFYLEYLSNPVGEHVPPGKTLLVTSNDGYNWGKPVVIFPEYKVPDGTTQPGETAVAKDLYAVMHQRMGFYVTNDKRLLAFGYYGICLNPQDGPNDGNGIGRVVREIYKDGTFGPVNFIRYNHGWNEMNTSYPLFTKSTDKGFVEACNGILADPLQTQQWNEEADRDDPLILLKGDYKAFCYYHLPDGRVAALWKHALTAISTDEGRTWTQPQRAPGFVNSNAKIWGQRTSDGKYATVYNPSDFRWPLAVSVSDDGLDYRNLLLVNGEIPTMRYGGGYKSYGPQYVRGIQERNTQPPDGKLWVAYSENKEDIWVSSIPVPVKSAAESHVNDLFDNLSESRGLENWNIYSPVWAKVGIETRNGRKCLSIQDKDEFDYAMACRLFPSSKKINVEFEVEAAQSNHGTLFVELQNEKNTAALRLVLDADSILKTKAGYRMRNLMTYQANRKYTVRIEAQTSNRYFEVFVDNNKVGNGLFFAPVASLQQIVFRTGEVRRYPDIDTPTDQDFDVKQDGKPLPEAKWWISSLKTWN
ncbi:MAG TPA: exo-alpha-sialidase, partial [Prolixibacteraceae bacterium]|nr:exo-alpha-sialidase [Prolixibacteraceae bacterium]